MELCSKISNYQLLSAVVKNCGVREPIIKLVVCIILLRAEVPLKSGGGSVEGPSGPGGKPNICRPTVCCSSCVILQ